MVPAPAVPEEAKRAMVRGKIAFEEAKTDADFKEAVLELQKAADAAPWLGAPYYTTSASPRSGRATSLAQSEASNSTLPPRLPPATPRL